MAEGTLIAIGTIGIALIGWFLKEIHKTFRETQQDVKTLLMNGARRDQQLDDMEQDIKSLEADIRIWTGKIETNSKDIKKLELEILKNK